MINMQYRNSHQVLYQFVPNYIFQLNIPNKYITNITVYDKHAVSQFSSGTLSTCTKPYFSTDGVTSSFC